MLTCMVAGVPSFPAVVYSSVPSTHWPGFAVVFLVVFLYASHSDGIRWNFTIDLTSLPR